jgi:hypothetical protein
MTLSLDGYFMLKFASSLLFIVFFFPLVHEEPWGAIRLSLLAHFYGQAFSFFFFKILHGVVWLLNEVLSREEPKHKETPLHFK